MKSNCLGLKKDYPTLLLCRWASAILKTFRQKCLFFAFSDSANVLKTLGNSVIAGTFLFLLLVTEGHYKLISPLYNTGTDMHWCDLETSSRRCCCDYLLLVLCNLWIMQTKWKIAWHNVVKLFFKKNPCIMHHYFFLKFAASLQGKRSF